MKNHILNAFFLTSTGFAITGVFLIWSGSGFDGRPIVGGDPIIAAPLMLCLEDPMCSTRVCSSFPMAEGDANYETVKLPEATVNTNCVFYENAETACNWDAAVAGSACATISYRCEKMEITPNHFICTSVAITPVVHTARACWDAPFPW